MPLSDLTPGSLLKLLLNDTPTPVFYMSLHTGDPGEGLANEVSYPSYERQRYGEATTVFPTMTTTIDMTPPIVVTHVALTASMVGGTAIMIAELSPSICIDRNTPPQVLLTYEVSELSPPVSQVPPPPLRATMGSRFAAVAAELEEGLKEERKRRDEDFDRRSAGLVLTED